MLKNIAMTVGGLVVMLGFWTIKGKVMGDKGLDKVPASIFGGGAGRVVIEVETTEPASIATTFEKGNMSDNGHQFLEAWQKVPPGKTTVSTDVSAETSCHLALLFPDTSVAKVGSSLTIRVTANGETFEDSQTLDQPLQPGYGMQVEINLEDCATGKREE